MATTVAHVDTGSLDPNAESLRSDEGAPDLEVLDQVQRRVLWLATRIVDAANRRGDTEVKVGGHQASSASMVSIMTALWFAHLDADDKVAVKPHASPAYHAIKYLTGEIDRSWLTRLRQRGGLQAYPSRTKDPDVADFSNRLRWSGGSSAALLRGYAALHRYTVRTCASVQVRGAGGRRGAG